MSAIGRVATLPGLPKGRIRELYARIPESQLQRFIRDECDRWGHCYFHDPDARRCPNCGHFFPDPRRRGMVDNVIAAPPVLILSESKTITGTLSPEQKRWWATLQRCEYLLADVWRPDQKQQIAELLADPEAWVRRLQAEGVIE